MTINGHTCHSEPAGEESPGTRRRCRATQAARSCFAPLRLTIGGSVTSLGALFLLALLLSAGCSGVGAFLGRGPLLDGVSAAPARITPNGDRLADVATVSYALARPARVSFYLLDAGGRRYAVHDNVARPAGSYNVTFDGGVADLAPPLLRRAVPNGDYFYVLEAVDDAGNRDERRGQLVVAESDSNPPTVGIVAAEPRELSPFDPRYSLDTRLSYHLSKPCHVTFYVQESDGRRTRLSEPLFEAAGAHSRQWDGLIRDKVPAAGIYRLVVQAKDAAGNVVEQSAQVAVKGVEEPDAAVVRVTFTPLRLNRGDLLKVEITVKNTGEVPLHTQGPEPGYVYTTRDTFASIEGGRYADRSRYWRVGVDWAGGLGAEGARYPYRWGLGEDLAPGEETTVVGYVRILEDYPQLRMYAGLVYEQVKYQGDKLGQQVIEVSH